MKLISALTLGLFVAGCESAYAGGHAVLTDDNGMTLYTFDNDTANTSNCYDGCASSWPPFLGQAGATRDGLTLIERRDGSQQWAKDGEPLYFWAGDQNPGDKTGDGVGGVWHVAE
ncbi:hypothetical protein L0666_13070 [Octadecabacter sp. CECT 8868]|uniref:COG4315 family predicted lipoprotein n=1 Tax=Octadecabacter algicola TaxID=2909342 RepID=UPI001F389FDD|nr:hypothetical protein [Octadecabacter algicola]MCF2905924.1 hypothetical protein [Octadecabacter algicola]